MDDFINNIYVREVKIQKEFAIKSYNELEITLSKGESPSDCIYHIHHFLVHVSNLIKIIFPADNNKIKNNKYIQNRAKTIRRKLKISDNEFDRKEIGIRNDFEHYDERIDFWVKNSINHNLGDMNLLVKGSISGIDINDLFRNYDPKNKILSFCGKNYNIDYLYNYIKNI